VASTTTSVNSGATTDSEMDFAMDDDDAFAGGPAAGDEFMAVKPWLGAVKEPSRFKHEPNMDEAPGEGLELEWVHGYRAQDCRNNVRYDAEGHIVYHTAAVGVVLDPRRHRQRFHFGHTDDIIGFAMHPRGHLAATGELGRTPKILIWDVHAGTTVLTLKGFHKRGVPLLEFSPSGEQLISVGLDDDHSLALYRVEDGTLLATAKGDRNRVLDVEFSPDGASVVTVGVKHVRFWHVGGRTLQSKKGIFGPNCSLCCALPLLDLMWSQGRRTGPCTDGRDAPAPRSRRVRMLAA